MLNTRGLQTIAGFKKACRRTGSLASSFAQN